MNLIKIDWKGKIGWLTTILFLMDIEKDFKFEIWCLKFICVNMFDQNGLANSWKVTNIWHQLYACFVKKLGNNLVLKLDYET